MKPHLKLVASASEKRTLRLRRPTNEAMRPREYLHKAEIEALIKAAKSNRYG